MNCPPRLLVSEVSGGRVGRFAVCLALLEIILQGLGSHGPALDSGVFIARGRCWLCAAVVSVSRAPGAVVAATHQVSLAAPVTIISSSIQRPVTITLAWDWSILDADWL